LAVLHAEMSRWAEAAGSARAALGLDLSLVEARIALVVSQARRGDLAAARDELRRLRAFDPDAADALRRALFAGKDGAVSLAPVGETDDPSGEESRAGKTVHRPSSYQSLARGP
jgi:hypothetical protein